MTRSKHHRSPPKYRTDDWRSNIIKHIFETNSQQILGYIPLIDYVPKHIPVGDGETWTPFADGSIPFAAS